MGVQLYPHQRKAIEQLRSGCILCGGVGTGKSLTALAYYYEKICGGSLQPLRKMRYPVDLYIITTARKRDTFEWEKELAHFLIQDYVNVKIDSWNNVKKYVEVKGAFIIFDEDKVIGNGSWVKSFYKIAENNRWIILTATPGDVWTDYIPVFVANGFYKNRTEFLNRHAVYARYSKYPRIDRFVEQGALVRFRNRILVNMTYDKPAVQKHETLSVLYDVTEYKRLMRERWDAAANEPVENVSKLCYLLRKVANESSDRQAKVLEICAIHPKVIIFYNFDYELELLKTLPYENGTKIAEWNGHRHQPIPEGERWVYLVNYMAGAEGWNCVETDTVIFYSLSYSYKTMVQAAGRIDRLNTPFRELYYYRLKSSAPIDLAISRALKQKRNFDESRFITNG